MTLLLKFINLFIVYLLHQMLFSTMMILLNSNSFKGILIVFNFNNLFYNHNLINFIRIKDYRHISMDRIRCKKIMWRENINRKDLEDIIQKIFSFFVRLFARTSLPCYPSNLIPEILTILQQS